MTILMVIGVLRSVGVDGSGDSNNGGGGGGAPNGGHWTGAG